MLQGRVNAKRLSAVVHPIRLAILETTALNVTSPSELAVALGEPLGVVAYHFEVLHTAGLIELTRTQRRRGFTKSFYRARGSGWQEVAETLRELLGDPRPGVES